MQVNMLEAKTQLSRLVKAALAGEEVIIASDGQPQVRLVPCTVPVGLRGFGAMASACSDPAVRASLDAAFSDAVDAEVAQLLGC